MQDMDKLGIDEKEAARVKACAAHPTLYGRKSNGKLKQWTVGWIEYYDGMVVRRTRYGQVGGTLKNSDKKMKAQNTGKANYRSPVDQGKFEAESAYKKQIDAEMQTSIEAAESYTPTLPMLVKTYKEHKGKITFPAYLQPKLNGVRCLGDVTNADDPQYISRKNKRYNDTVSHFTPALLKAGMPTVWDGEIYKHGWSFAKILQRVKQLYHDSNQLQYWIYDIADDGDLTFEDRHKLVKQTLSNDHPIVIVPTVEVNSDEEIWTIHDEWVQLGFEGAIVRNKTGKYRKGLVRSYDVMRVKNYHDAEFKIVGGKCEEVKVKDEWVKCVIFTCDTGHGGTFDVRPTGTVEDRRKMYDELDSLIGQEMTVRYAEINEDGNPLMPVGVAVRDYE